MDRKIHCAEMCPSTTIRQPVHAVVPHKRRKQNTWSLIADWKVLKMTPETQTPPPLFPASYCVMNLWWGQGAHKAPSVPRWKSLKPGTKGEPQTRGGEQKGGWKSTDPSWSSQGALEEWKSFLAPRPRTSGNLPPQGTEFKNASDQGLHGGIPHTLWKGQIWELKFGNKTQEPQKSLHALTQ